MGPTLDENRIMRQGARICLILCAILLVWTAGHSWSLAAEGFHPEGFDARRVETDKRALDERQSEEKREDSEAWFKKSVTGKDLTHEPKAEFHDANRLLIESEAPKAEGAKSVELRKQEEYDLYKEREREKPPEDLDVQGRLKWQLKQAEDVKEMRQAWDDKYDPGRHAEAIRNTENRILNLKNKMGKEYGEK